jgi:hypothetical protein
MYNDSFIKGINLDIDITAYIDEKINVANEVLSNHGLPYRLEVSNVQRTDAYDDYSLNAFTDMKAEFLDQTSALRQLYNMLLKVTSSSVFYFMTGVSNEGILPDSIWSGSNATSFMVGSNDARYNFIYEYATEDSGSSVPTLATIHELGHLLGCGHDWYFSDVFKVMYNNAHISGSIGTLMSYANTRVNFFSTPSLVYPGTDTPMGNEHADNLRFLTEDIAGEFDNRLHKMCNVNKFYDAPQINIDNKIYEEFDIIAPCFISLSVGDEYIYPDIISPLGLNVTIVNEGDVLDTSISGLYKPVLVATDSEGRVNHFNFYILVE